METVSNLTSAASRAIWGDPKKDADTTQTGEEPRSGEVGNTSAGEPYDKGNEEPTSTPSATESVNPASASNTDTDTMPSTTDTNTTSTKTDTPGNTTSTMPIRSEHETDKTGVTSAHNPTSATSSDPPSSSNDTSNAGPTPSVGADPPSAPQETTKHQGAGKPTDAPAEGSDEHNRIAETKKEAEEAAKVDTSGPGPKPLNEVKKDGATTGATGGDDEDGPQKESHGEGTGEKYVKSTGLKADGGDFDASRPGAAKEADRLLEEKGVHRTEAPSKPKPAAESSTTDSKDSSESAGKTSKLSSLKEKIKDKLHKNDKY